MIKQNIFDLMIGMSCAEVSVNTICVTCFVSDKGHSLKSSKKPRGEITANKTSEF